MTPPDSPFAWGLLPTPGAYPTSPALRPNSSLRLELQIRPLREIGLRSGLGKYTMDMKKRETRDKLRMDGFLGFLGLLGFEAFKLHEPWHLFYFCFFAFFAHFKYLGLHGVAGLMVAILGVIGVVEG